jgi:hypothetical protein
MDNGKSTQAQIDSLTNMLFETKGQLLAMGLAIRSLLLSHPDRERATEAMSRELSRWETSGLYSGAPDATVQGFGRAKSRVLSADDAPQ